MEWVDAFSALVRDSSKRTLRVQPLHSLPASLTLADELLTHFAPLPSVPFVFDEGEQRLLADLVAVATGEAVLVAEPGDVRVVTVVGVAVLSVGEPDGLVTYSALTHPITVEFGARQLRVRLAMLAQTSFIGL